MTNPVFKAIPADAWEKIATNVQTGSIHILNPTDEGWFQTFVDTGDPAPTDAPEVKLKFQSDDIDSSVGIDVYVYHVGAVGRLRVDL